MKILHMFGALCVFMLSVSVYADDEPSVYCRSSSTLTTKIYFVNGVWNTEHSSSTSLWLIKQAYKQRLNEEYPNQSFDFRLAYNYSFSKVQDLVEVVAQKEQELGLESDELTPRQYLALYMSAQVYEDESDEDLPPILRSRLLSVTMEDYFAAQFTESVNADEIMQIFRNDLLEGARLLVFAHSQGNMYVGEAIHALMGEYSANINMVGIASPAKEAYNGSDYFTAHDDRVINNLKSYYEVLASNIDNDPGVFNDNRDVSNHQFAPSYFAENLASRSLIDDAFFRRLAILQFPTAVVNQGIITATLTWGEQPDVDLHAFEPNGSHVYYASRIGISGYLDLDDTNSYGPEHYYVSCDTLESGTYSIGVNYYAGFGPEIALVQIGAGSTARTFTVNLDSSRGSLGNDTPIPVADIVVSGDAESGYDFSIENLVPDTSTVPVPDIPVGEF